MSNQRLTYWKQDILYDIVDGVLRSEVPKRNGIARYWHPNGQLAKEMPIVNGKADGLIREWHENGNLFRETSCTAGKINGVVKQWSSSGRLLGESSISMDRGTRREWYDDGSPKLEFEQVTEALSRGKVWDDLGKAHTTFLRNGKPISKRKFEEYLPKSRDET